MNPDDKRLKNLRQFKPGNSGNTRGETFPAEIVQARNLARNQMIEAGSRLLRQNLEQLKAIVKHQDSPSADVILATILLNAARYGDPRRMEFVCSRIMGRVPVMVEDKNGNEVPLSVTHQAVIELIRDLSQEDKNDGGDSEAS